MREPINIEKCVEVGFIKKTHGIQGEVMVNFHPEMEETLENLEYLFFMVDGLPVPFFISEIYFRSDVTANIKFDLIDSQERAKQFIGCTLFTESQNILQSDESITYSILIGVTVIDKTYGQLGVISNFDDYGGNVVLTIQYLDREILIPLNNDLIISYDQEAATLIMDCPEGLLDLQD